MTDNRKPWEIVYSLWCQTAASYLDELDMAQSDPALAAIYATIYRVENGGLGQWARERIERAIEKANAILAAQGGAVTTAPIVDSYSLARLAELGLRGSADDVATVRTE